MNRLAEMSRNEQAGGSFAHPWQAVPYVALKAQRPGGWPGEGRM